VFEAGDEEPREHVVAYASGLGYLVTSTQLVRWHRAGLLPRPSQRSLGRGRGTMTTYPPGTAAQVVALCQIRDDERRLDRIAFRLWWEGFNVDLAVIRKQLQAVLRSIEADAQRAADDLPRRGVDAIMRRSFGQRRVEAMMTAAMCPPADLDRMITWEAPWPPSLDHMADSIGQLVADRITNAPTSDLVAQATDEDLILARERTRALLGILQNCLAPLGWLYGKGGAAFRVMDRLLNSLAPADYVGIVALTLALTPAIPLTALGELDSGSEPPLAEDLRLVLAIRDQVPGAAEVFTPMAVRALLRNKEAAGRYRPDIEAFVSAHRQEIDAVLTARELGEESTRPVPGRLPVPDSPTPTPRLDGE
jgi:hypothetical protein